MTDPIGQLRVLIANEQPERLAAAADVVTAAGHEVVEATVDVAAVALLTRQADPDVAVVAVGRSAGHALDQVEQIVEESSCPVIVLLDESDPAFVAEAAERGVFASALHGSPEELQSSIEVALRRFAELRDLQRAAQRRAIVERAKGILMERHGIDERDAFELLRSHARRQQQKLVNVAHAILVSHRVLPARSASDLGPAQPPGSHGSDVTGAL